MTSTSPASRYLAHDSIEDWTDFGECASFALQSPDGAQPGEVFVSINRTTAGNDGPGQQTASDIEADRARWHLGFVGQFAQRSQLRLVRRHPVGS